MSGVSYSHTCPSCKTEDSVMAYEDWKPYSSSSGICLECGFKYWTEEGCADKDELEEARRDYEYTQKKAK